MKPVRTPDFYPFIKHSRPFPNTCSTLETVPITKLNIDQWT